MRHLKLMKHTSTTDTALKGVPFLRTDYCGTVQGFESSVATVDMIREQKYTPGRDTARRGLRSTDATGCEP